MSPAKRGHAHGTRVAGHGGAAADHATGGRHGAAPRETAGGVEVERRDMRPAEETAVQSSVSKTSMKP